MYHLQVNLEEDIKKKLDVIHARYSYHTLSTLIKKIIHEKHEEILKEIEVRR